MGRELELFAKSMVYGALLVLIYDGMQILWIMGGQGKCLEAAKDLVFWSSTGLFLFYRFLTENHGTMRWYLFVGILSGAGVWCGGIRRFYKIIVFIWAKRLHFCLQRVTIFLLVKMRKFWLKMRKGLKIDSKGAWNERKKKCCAKEKRRSTSDKGTE